MGYIHLGISNTQKACKVAGLEEIIWGESAQALILGVPAFTGQAETKEPTKHLLGKVGGNPEN